MAMNEGLDKSNQMSLKDSMEHVDIVLSEGDLNGDGKISYEEFMTAEGM